MPPVEIIRQIAQSCQVEPDRVTLLVAPTASLAGGLQIVARSVETAMHKLVELGFDTSRVVSGQGWAPLPPVARDDLTAIGRTNDAILYGSSVILCVTGDDESIAEIGPKMPSDASRDHGEPFLNIFRRYNSDFYAVDKMLFSPARIEFQNLTTGRTQRFGSLAEEIVSRSFQS
jgi:methenyltetrahydromethanopterin cyclohydrolase